MSSKAKMAEFILVNAEDREHMIELALAASSSGVHDRPKNGDTTHGFQDGSYLHIHADGSATYS